MAKYIKKEAIEATRIVRKIFNKDKRIVVNFLRKIQIMKRFKRLVITVAIAAPYKLYFGIKIKFKITFVIAPERVIKNIFVC